MPTVPCYFSNGGAHAYEPDGDTWTINTITARVFGQPYAGLFTRIYPSEGDFYPEQSAGVTVIHTTRVTTPRESPAGMSFSPEVQAQIGYFGTITYPDDDTWHGSALEVRYVRNLAIHPDLPKLRGRAAVAAPLPWLHAAGRTGKQYLFNLSFTTLGGSIDQPSRLASVQYQIGGTVHTLPASSSNFPPQGAAWEWGGFTSRGKVELTYSGDADNAWGEVKFRGVDVFGQIGGWLTIHIPPKPEFTVDGTHNPVFTIEATGSYDTDGEIVEYSLDLENWQESPILTLDYTDAADAYIDDFDVIFQFYVRDNHSTPLVARSEEKSLRVQARTPRFDSLATGTNMIYRARPGVEPGYPFSASGVWLERKQQPHAGWQFLDFLPDHVDPSLTRDRQTGVIYLMARDRTDQKHKLYRCTDGEHFLEMSSS